MINIFQKLTLHSKKALKDAFNFALSSGQEIITPQHILYGLSQQKGSIGAQILAKSKISSDEIKKTLGEKSTGQRTITQIGLAPATRKLLEKAFLIASINKHKYIGTEHLLASILVLNDPEINNLFQKINVNLIEIQKQIDTVLNSTSKFSDLADAANYFKDKNDNPYLPETSAPTMPQASVLDLFATNLTDSKVQKNVDPVIGRLEEINRLVQILSRRTKNNPILLGDAGVGKTAIVEGLAKKILQGDVPEVLVNKKIYTLDLSLVVAGTSFRGEFENRFKQILMAVKKDPNIILFIDELHNITGAGSATGSMDAANILKPALARGEIRCIGATTLEDYKKHIENDSALERRFQPIIINQPTAQKTIEILQGIKTNYEIFHQVKISDEAIIAATELSQRYIADRFLPDKAIDLIDEAASAVKVKQLANPLAKEIKKLEKKLKETRQEKEKAVDQGNFSLALGFRQVEQEALIKLKKIREEYFKDQQKIQGVITKNDIVQLVAKITGVPLADLILEEKNRLLKLEKLLAKKIIDQGEALQSIAEFIRRSRTGISDVNRPIGSFIFLGPSGVGKTELAKVLAEVVFGSNESLVKIDMSEFAESFNISKLIGAPAGYVGYKEGAKLTDSVKRRPYSVVLFDEIEKAHPQTFGLLLQILEDGYLTDATGKKINFKNTIIIMTSNLGSENFNRQSALGFESADKDKKLAAEKSFKETEREVHKKLKDKFPPEFISRIDKTIVFKPLSPDSIIKISRFQLEELKQRLASQGLEIEFDPKTARVVAKISYAPEIGARAIRKTIQDLIENKIANKILANKSEVQKITVKVKDNKIII